MSICSVGSLNTEGKPRKADCCEDFGPGAAGLAEGQQRRAGALSLALCGLRDV